MPDSVTSSLVATAVKADTAHKVTQVGASGAVIFGLALNEWGVIVGIVVAIGGLGIQWYYKRKEYRLKELYYEKHGVRDATDGEPS